MSDDVSKIVGGPSSQKPVTVSATPKRLLKSVGLVVVIVALAGLLWWYSEPWYRVISLELSDTVEARARTEDVNRLISMGPRSLPAVVAGIRHGHTYVTAQAPHILGAIGDPAHLEMIRAIKSEGDTGHKVVLIAILQEAFGDYRFVDIWLERARRSGGNDLRLTRSIQRGFRMFPPIFANGDYNPQFIAWYLSQRERTTNLPPFPPLKATRPAADF